MDENTANELNSQSAGSPQLTPEALRFLMSAAKWGKFLAIIGFICLGFLILAGIFMGLIFTIMESKMTSFLGSGMLIAPKWLSVFFVLFSVITFLPVYFLNVFSNKVTRSVRNNDTNNLTSAFRNLKNLFAFIGIYTIVMIVIYIIIIILFASAAALAM